MEASTSVRRGQLCITLIPPVSMVAARIGSTLFFAPCTATEPDSLLPPSIKKALNLDSSASVDFVSPSYAEGSICV